MLTFTERVVVLLAIAMILTGLVLVSYGLTLQVVEPATLDITGR